MTGRLGSLFSGVGGLDLAVEQFGYATVWQVEIDGWCRDQLARHWPDAIRYPDVTEVDWSSVPAVDALCGGYPCPPFSSAGKRLGEADERYLWPHFLDAIRALRPRVVFAENVRGHLSLGFDRVLADLSALGYCVRWTCLRASDIGAPHRRERLFFAAVDTGHGAAQDPHIEPRDQRRFAAPGQTQGGRARSDVGGRGRASASHAHLAGSQGPQSAGRRVVSTRGGGQAPADADHAADDRERPRPQPRRRSEAAADPASFDWRGYAPAIERWGRVLGRAAPAPLDERGRLSADFVLWMQGFPADWVGDGTRGQRLRAYGNSVVPLQAVAAFSLLLDAGEAVA